MAQEIEPQQHQLWPKFVAYADQAGVSLEAQEDWEPWWVCFLSGVHALDELLCASLTLRIDPHVQRVRERRLARRIQRAALPAAAEDDTITSAGGL